MTDQLTITRGFTDAMRTDVAVLYDAAFGAKIGIAIPDAATRLRLLAGVERRGLQPRSC